MNFAPVTPRAFAAIQNLNIAELAQCSASEIRPLLPCLVRMSLLPPLDGTKSWMDNRKQLLSILAGIEVVNNIVSLLQVSFHELEVDVKKEQQLRYERISLISRVEICNNAEAFLYLFIIYFLFSFIFQYNDSLKLQTKNRIHSSGFRSVPQFAEWCCDGLRESRHC